MKIVTRNHVWHITWNTVKKFALEAFIGFVLWTLFLTPYMWFIVKTTIDQYLNWLVMEALLVPPIAIVVINATNWITEKLGLRR